MAVSAERERRLVDLRVAARGNPVFTGGRDGREGRFVRWPRWWREREIGRARVVSMTPETTVNVMPSMGRGLDDPRP